ncbi:hypothetical protein MNBD_ALPHA02-1965 [hydrothermal vent metagenome]|uniref:Uncharacterized protein n=1 Tax=hydrothermal vent metagenome TaxID=652676 RepID=A0A3B0RL40_9ZZZZ
MKLRIEVGKISFRLDFDELVRLLTDGDIQQKIDLPQGQLSYIISVLPTGSPADFQTRDGVYILFLARDVIEDHKSALPALKGIVNHFATEKGGEITVALEVNLKKKVKHSLE